MSPLAAAAFLLSVGIVSGCKFARPGMQMPPGHPQINASALPVCHIAGCYTPDTSNTAVTNFVPEGCGSSPQRPCSNWGHLQTDGFIPSLVQLAADYQADLCYWSFQTLPPPPDAESNFTDADAMMIYELGTAASTELHGLVGNGVFEGGIATSGNLVNRNLCNRGVLKGPRCNPHILNSATPVPAAVPMLRIAAPSSTRNATAIASDINNNVTYWRQASDMHAPNIKWSGQSRWGDSGQIIFKVVKCADIPVQYRTGTKHREPDSLASDHQQSFYNENLRVWQSLDSLCPWTKWVSSGPGFGCGRPSTIQAL